MTDLILRAAVAFLAVLGLISLCEQIMYHIWKPKSMGTMRFVLPLKGHDEGVEYGVRTTAETIRWMRVPFRKELICVDYGMDEEAKKICSRLCEDDPMISLCKAEELTEKLEHTFANM